VLEAGGDIDVEEEPWAPWQDEAPDDLGVPSAQTPG
jgi:hypothetical protein